MRAATFSGLTGPDDVAITQLPDPQLDANEVAIGIEAASINRHDLRILEGESNWVDESDLPFVAGADIAGRVRETGEAVNNVSTGDRVVHCPVRTCGACEYCFDGPENRCERFDMFHGGLAELAVVPSKRLLIIPENVTMEAAASLPIAYMTAWHMLRRVKASVDDLVFIPGATGDVGIAAIQLVNAIGARSIATTTSERKANRLEAIGADHVVIAADPSDMNSKTQEIGEPDVALNHLGGEYVNMGLELLSQGGRMAICGRTTGDWSEIHTKHLYRTHKQIVGSAAGTQSDLEKMVGLTSRGEISPIIGECYELNEAADAFRDMKQGEIFGSQVILP